MFIKYRISPLYSVRQRRRRSLDDKLICNTYIDETHVLIEDEGQSNSNKKSFPSPLLRSI